MSADLLAALQRAVEDARRDRRAREQADHENHLDRIAEQDEAREGEG